MFRSYKVDIANDRNIVDMLGTIDLQDQLSALIKTPDGTVQTVKTGNYMGQNEGRITYISETSHELLEFVLSEDGRYREQQVTAALSQYTHHE